MSITAASILADLDLTIGTARASDVQHAYRLADHEGTIQASDMLALVSDPRHHTTTSLRNALLILGCAEVSA